MECKIPDERKGALLYMVCDHVSCALRGYGPDLRKSGPFASLRSVQGAAPLAPLRGYPCTLAGKVHPLRVCTFPARLKPDTVTLSSFIKVYPALAWQRPRRCHSVGHVAAMFQRSVSRRFCRVCSCWRMAASAFRFTCWSLHKSSWMGLYCSYSALYSC